MNSNTKLEEQLPDQQEAIQEAVEKADVTRKARQEAYSIVHGILNRADRGDQIKHDDLMTAIRNLFIATGHMDELLQDVATDMITSIKAIASSELNLLSINIKLKTFVTLLERKGILTEEELMKLHDTEIFPEIMKGLGIDMKVLDQLRSNIA